MCSGDEDAPGPPLKANSTGREVRAAGAELGATIRRHLERLATVVSAQVDERDRDRIFTFVTDHVEQVLSDLERVTSRAHARSCATPASRRTRASPRNWW